MSSIITYPLDAIEYDATDAAGYFSARGSGVYSAEEDFAVTPAGGSKVNVSAGRAWVHPSRFTGYSIIQRAPAVLDLPIADSAKDRVDRVVLRYDAAAAQSMLLVLQGTAAGAQDIARTELLYDLCLAEITRPAGSTSITASDIRDTRLDEALCGLMRDAVTRIPTEQLQAEAEDRLNTLQKRADSILQNYSGGYLGSYDLVLQPSNWAAAAGSTGYSYQYDATVPDARTEHVPIGSTALGSIDVATAAGLAPVCETYDGLVRFYSKKIPEAALNISVTLLGSSSSGNASLGLATDEEVADMLSGVFKN